MDASRRMSTWDGIRGLARRLLGIAEVEPTDLSKISREITQGDHPPKAVQASPQAEIEAIQVLPEYEFVLGAINSGCAAVFVTGRAGTGKSTLIRFLSEQIGNCAVVAPTALAASNVRGSTIHSFFGIPPKNVNPDEAADPTKKMVAVIETINALVVDEVSMVTPDLVDCMNNTLQKVRRDRRQVSRISIGVNPNSPQAPSQSSTLNPPIRRNSRRLWLTSVTSKASAWPAIWRS